MLERRCHRFPRFNIPEPCSAVAACGEDALSAAIPGRAFELVGMAAQIDLAAMRPLAHDEGGGGVDDGGPGSETAVGEGAAA